MVMSVNIEILSSVKQQILAELYANHKCDVLCMQETHRGPGAGRPRVPGMNLVAEITHEQYGSAVLTRDSCTCESTSTSSIDNIETIKATLNGVSVNSYYKSPNQAFDFRSSSTDTTLQVIIGEFNSHITEWGYRSTNDDGNLVERWCDENSLTLINDPKLARSFNNARWKQGYNPDLSFVSPSIVHQCEKLVLEVIPKTQHRPIAIKIKAAVPKSVDMGIADIVSSPDIYGSFVDPI